MYPWICMGRILHTSQRIMCTVVNISKWRWNRNICLQKYVYMLFLNIFCLIVVWKFQQVLFGYKHNILIILFLFTLLINDFLFKLWHMFVVFCIDRFKTMNAFVRTYNCTLLSFNKFFGHSIISEPKNNEVSS